MTAETEIGRFDQGPARFVKYGLLAAITMGYGWVYRGTVGHEYGAMVPGALLGLVLCLGSGRLDWHRRAAVVGLFAAVGWAWGGSISYMEQTFYVMSDSFPDVLYGYSVLFFLGALWAGCGGALLGLGLTESRSELECLTRAFVAVCALYLAAFGYFALMPEHYDAYITFTVTHFHNGDWLSATLTLVASSIYWVVRPQDRRGTVLLLGGAVAWWIGYGLLTKLGGVRLAPLHRSESWGGVLGVLVVFLVYLVRRQNRAALMLSLYGCVGGGLAFVLAVFIHHPLALRWGPFADANLRIPAWRCAEVSFGFLMGLSLAVGAWRLLRGGIAPPAEDRDRTPLDTFAVFVMTIALPWINFRRHTARVLRQAPSTDENTLLGLSTGLWYVIVGVIATIPVLYLLRRYRLGDRDWTPRSAFGKGICVTLLLIGVTAAAQLLDGHPSRETLIANLCLWLPAVLATCLLVSFTASTSQAEIPKEAQTPADDARWRVGWRFVACGVMSPVVILTVTFLSMSMQDGPHPSSGRLRFGPNAYWQQTARLQGEWEVIGMADRPGSESLNTDNLPFSQFHFNANRSVSTISPSGERVEAHRWFLKNQYIWLQWFGKVNGHEEQAEVPLQFHQGRLEIAWPPHQQNQGFLVLERQPQGSPGHGQ